VSFGENEQFPGLKVNPFASVTFRNVVIDSVDIVGEPDDAGLTKAYCTEAALEIVLDAVQIHGGYGYMHKYGVEKMMRDIKVLQLLGGSGPVHQIQAIARDL
jgi:alkylation response protein AidB-like acyl-CoA dehydrogenase